MTPDYEQALAAIYEAALRPASWPLALQVVADHIGAIGGMLAHQTPQAGQSRLVTSRLREDLNAFYLEHYQRNHYTAAFHRLPFGQVHHGNAIIDRRSLERSAFHADILAPQGINDLLAVTSADLTRSGGIGGVSFMLNPRQADAASGARRDLARLVPHIQRAISLMTQTDKQHERMVLAEQLLETLAGPALLVGHDGVILHANSVALSLLSRGDGLLLANAEGIRLQAELPSDNRHLADHIAEAIRALRDPGRTLPPGLRIARPSGKPAYWIVVNPLPPLANSSWENVTRKGVALVQIIVPHEPLTAQAERLRIIAGLTAAEAQVAALIGAGYALPAVARALGISVNTAKTHLAHCFAKTETSSQSGLAALLARVPG